MKTMIYSVFAFMLSASALTAIRIHAVSLCADGVQRRKVQRRPF